MHKGTKCPKEKFGVFNVIMHKIKREKNPYKIPWILLDNILFSEI